MFVGRSDLLGWAESFAAPGDFPRLIRRLIAVSGGEGLERVAFRADKGVYLEGWDGSVVSEAATPWIPEGHSGWELGTNELPKPKATDDYNKRTANPGVLDPSITTFVFATPRRWTDKDEWESERRASGPWRNVRALDVDDLASWLEETPSVALWFSRILHNAAGVAVDLEGLLGELVCRHPSASERGVGSRRSRVGG